MSKCLCGGELEEKKNAKIVIGYTCIYCKKLYPNYQDAVDCEDSHDVSRETAKELTKEEIDILADHEPLDFPFKEEDKI